MVKIYEEYRKILYFILFFHMNKNDREKDIEIDAMKILGKKFLKIIFQKDISSRIDRLETVSSIYYFVYIIHSFVYSICII